MSCYWTLSLTAYTTYFSLDTSLKALNGIPSSSGDDWLNRAQCQRAASIEYIE